MTNLKILLEADGGGTLGQKRHKTVVNICRAGTNRHLRNAHVLIQRTSKVILQHIKT